MHSFGQGTPKDFDATLISRVQRGIAWVISANEYNSLHTNLKSKYYPLFRRADTTYRMYPKLMKARIDIDPNTQVIRLIPRKNVVLSKQIDRNSPITLQKEILPVNQSVKVTTPLSSKPVNQIARETQATLNKYVGVKTTYTRY